MNKILEATKFVVDNSKFVSINKDKLFEFADTFKYDKVHHWLSDIFFNSCHLSDNDKLNFLFIFDSLSFCYWGDPKWTIEFEGKSYDGAFGMLMTLIRAINEGYEILSFDYCANLSKKDFSHILRANIEIPLFKERLDIINEIGRIIINKYDGQLSNLINKANGDSEELIKLIIEDFPSFRDESQYDNKTIYFYKRAQLLTFDIYRVFNGKSFGDLKNIDSITALADYKLPQILKRLNILIYSDDLSNSINDKQELIHDSLEEIEIRSNTIWAIEYIKQQIQKRYPKITSIEVNDYLWLKAQEKSSNDMPYHHTRTIAY